MKTKGLDPTDIFKAIYRTSLVFGNYIYHARKGFVCSERPTKVLIFMIFTLALLWSMQDTHLKWLHRYFPEFFSQSLVHSLLLIHWFWHFLVLSTLFSLPMIYLLAVGRIRKMKACTQAFRRAGLKNALGVSPKAIDVTYIGPFRQKIKVNTEGIPVQEFEKKINFLRSCLNTQVESIVEREQPQYIDLTITSLRLPEKVLYESACGRAINSGEFILGKTHGNILIQNLFELPHILVAGTTGMGKSYFLRQMLLNLLENTPNLQVYALDFKEGIAMKPFREHPRVHIVKDTVDAIEVLEKVRVEMRERFKILEASDDDIIDFQKHKKGRILVLIDECSMLYVGSKSDSIEQNCAVKATEITNQIAKLSRAAGIHLVLGTQKISKETVSTHIQENIEGRVCFKVNSIQGSALVLGNKAAYDLPKIAGRAITKVGVDINEVQTPFISTDDIKERVMSLAAKEKVSEGVRVGPKQVESEPSQQGDEGEFHSLVTLKEVERD